MIRILIVCLLFLFVFQAQALEDKALKINLIVDTLYSKGLAIDTQILTEALTDLGCKIEVIDLRESRWNRAHINIFIQNIIPEKLPMATLNWLIPNPEWYWDPLHWLDCIDLILCRTKESERIFKETKRPVYFLGFTSPDCYMKEVKKNYSHLLHMPGKSLMKGTKAIQKAWKSHPEFPLITVVKYFQPVRAKLTNLESIETFLEDEQLRRLQNECGIHLCPSETEGFGHYLMEAMSAGAVVLTTAAPPMNEFIQDPRCLIPYEYVETVQLATCYHITPQELERTVERVLALPNETLKAIGDFNRSFYLQKKGEYLFCLAELIESVSSLSE